MQVLLGDTAYGAVGRRIEAQKTCGVKLIAPPPRGAQIADFSSDRV
jgi:hypothetical protein